MAAKRDRHEVFVNLAESRVNKCLDQMRLIGNLSAKSNYMYSDEDVEKINQALQNGLRNLVEKRFEKDGDVLFSLSGSEEDQHV